MIFAPRDFQRQNFSFLIFIFLISFWALIQTCPSKTPFSLVRKPKIDREYKNLFNSLITSRKRQMIIFDSWNFPLDEYFWMICDSLKSWKTENEKDTYFVEESFLNKSKLCQLKKNDLTEITIFYVDDSPSSPTSLTPSSPTSLTPSSPTSLTLVCSEKLTSKHAILISEIDLAVAKNWIMECDANLRSAQKTRKLMNSSNQFLIKKLR